MRVDRHAPENTRPYRKGIYTRWDERTEREAVTKAHYVDVSTGRTVCGFVYAGEFIPATCDDEMCQRCVEAVDLGRVPGFEEEEWDE